MGKSLVTAEIVAPDGRPARRGLLTYEEVITRTRASHPDWPPRAVLWQADKLYKRLPLIEQALAVGLEETWGRKLLMRWKHGLGIDLGDDEFGAAMTALEPVERGFVLTLLKDRLAKATA